MNHRVTVVTNGHRLLLRKCIVTVVCVSSDNTSFVCTCILQVYIQ